MANLECGDPGTGRDARGVLGHHPQRPSVRHPHTCPTVVTGTADDPRVAARLDWCAPLYEVRPGSPECWGRLCARLPSPPSRCGRRYRPTCRAPLPPKATLALVERATRIIGVPLPTTDLEIASAAYLRQIDELVDSDEDTRGLRVGSGNRRRRPAHHRRHRWRRHRRRGLRTREIWSKRLERFLRGQLRARPGGLS